MPLRAANLPPAISNKLERAFPLTYAARPRGPYTIEALENVAVRKVSLEHTIA